jgi:hypothetical protein
MQYSPAGPNGLDPATSAFFRRALDVLREAGVPFLVGGAYALQYYTGVTRHTKDFDVFVDQRDFARALQTFTDAGYRAEATFPHWLGKVFSNGAFIDIIFGSGNATAHVDAGWFEHAEEGHILGRPVLLCPVEETIWSKSFVMERERYDGADIAHLIRARGSHLDWDRLVHRFGPNWRVLLSYLVLFGFIYPGEMAVIPSTVIDDLTHRLHDEQRHAPRDTRLCRGTLLSREQFLIDIGPWGYQDAREAPQGRMTPADIAQWTAAIGSEHPPAAPGA